MKRFPLFKYGNEAIEIKYVNLSPCKSVGHLMNQFERVFICVYLCGIARNKFIIDTTIFGMFDAVSCVSHQNEFFTSAPVGMLNYSRDNSIYRVIIPTHSKRLTDEIKNLCIEKKYFNFNFEFQRNEKKNNIIKWLSHFSSYLKFYQCLHTIKTYSTY